MKSRKFSFAILITLVFAMVSFGLRADEDFTKKISEQFDVDANTLVNISNKYD